VKGNTHDAEKMWGDGCPGMRGDRELETQDSRNMSGIATLSERWLARIQVSGKEKLKSCTWRYMLKSFIGGEKSGL